MVLVDKKMLLGGIAMITVGFALLIYLNSTVPVGMAGMTEEETLDLMTRERENRNYTTLAAMLAGVGFLLLLISFGARKRKGGAAKTLEKKQES